MIFKKGELFNGPGGLALATQGLEVKNKETGEIYQIKHEWSNDYDEDSCKTYSYNICGKINHPSVHVESVENLPIGNREILGNIDCFSFGFPCNDFSLVGKNKGINGIYGGLYKYGVKVLKEYQPKFFVAENVGGLRSSNEGDAFVKILKDLKNSGYVITPHLYKFEEYGVPQARHRIIIVGIRNDLERKGIKFKIPAPTTYNNYRTSKEAILFPPIKEDADNHVYTKHSAKVKEMLDHIPAGENAWYDGIPKDMRLNVKKAKLSSIYKRLDPTKPAYTVTGSGGGGTHMYHWTESRALTNRERARLQTFPDDFVFIGKKDSVRKQIGMAVPPKGARIIFEAILKTFAGIPYKSVEPIDKLQLKED